MLQNLILILHQVNFLKKVSATTKGTTYIKTKKFSKTFEIFEKIEKFRPYYRKDIFAGFNYNVLCEILDNISDSDFYLKVLKNDKKALKIFYDMRFL